MTKLVRNATAKSQETAHKAPRRNGLHSKSKYGKRKEYLTQIDLGNQPDAITITPKSVAKLIQRGRKKVIGTKFDPYGKLVDPTAQIKEDATEILISFIRDMGYMSRQDIINHTCLILAIAKGPRVWQRIRKSVAAGNIVTAVMH